MPIKLWVALLMLLSASAWAQQPGYSLFNDTNDLVVARTFLASRGSWINHNLAPHQNQTFTLPPNEPYGKVRIDTQGKGYVEYDVSTGNAYRIYFNPNKQVLDLTAAKPSQPIPPVAPPPPMAPPPMPQKMAPQANAGIPMGPYQNSCQEIFLSENKANLFATCRTRSGASLVTALLGLNRCQSPINNEDGYLRCQFSNGPINQEIRVIYVNNRQQSTPINSVLIKDPNGQQWAQYSTRQTNPGDRQMIWLEKQLPCSLYVNVDQRQVALMDTCNKRQFSQFDQSYRID